MSGASSSEQLIGAVRANNEGLVQSLFEGKSPAVVAATINATTDPVGNGLLHIAAHSGSYDALDLLLDQEGVEVDPRTRLGANTPLHLAAAYSDAEVAKALVEMLVECGADPLLRNGDGKRPIQLAKSDDVVLVLRGAQYAAEAQSQGVGAADVDALGVESDGESDNEIE